MSIANCVFNQNHICSIVPCPYTEKQGNQGASNIEALIDSHSIWYFGYGSNLNNTTFLDRRGIRPLKQIRLCVPAWRLTFEVAGIPYSEPGFGSIRPKTKEELVDLGIKDLQGLAYLVTIKDYKHIIATEGGESAYRQIRIRAIDPLTSESYDVWTLQALHARPSCQPSLRYISIIQAGALEHDFPDDYLEFLKSIEPYKLRKNRQKLGARIFLGFWLPVIGWLFALRNAFASRQRPVPEWLQRFNAVAFQTMWQIHDKFWSEQFGPGDHNLELDAPSA